MIHGRGEREEPFYSSEQELGWRPEVAFEEGLAATVAWYRGNGGWWG